jgi:Sec7-like guanine-nucleotide exchange factor
MLNTDLQKPNVKAKMTLQEFIANTSKPLEYSKVTAADLTQLYESLKATPFAFAPVSDDTARSPGAMQLT